MTAAACAKCGYAPDAEITASWTFTLDKRITSANLRTVNAGASRWRYAKERDEWQWLVRSTARTMVAVSEARRLNKPSSKRRVTIARHYAGRCQEIDRDNLVSGCKPLVDALKREGVVHDDDSAHMELHVVQERGKHNVTVVTVEELA